MSSGVLDFFHLLRPSTLFLNLDNTSKLPKENSNYKVKDEFGKLTKFLHSLIAPTVFHRIQDARLLFQIKGARPLIEFCALILTKTKCGLYSDRK
jgi:hypothetical protein